MNMAFLQVLLLLAIASVAAVTDQDWADLKGIRAVNLACAYDTSTSTLYMGGAAGGTGDGTGGAIVKKVQDFNWSPMNQMMELVRDITLSSNGTVYAAGGFSFTGLNNKVLKGVAKWNGSYWENVGGGLEPAGGGVYALIEKDGFLFAGGSFYLPNAPTTLAYFAMWDGINWTNLSRDLNGPVFDIIVTSNNDMIIGGSFGTATNMLNRVARFTQAKWEPVGQGFDGPVHSFAFSPDGILYAGGDFTASNGVGMAGVAQLRNGSWQSLGTGLSGGTLVRALDVDETNTLYVGGHFTSAGGFPAKNIARWNGIAWTALGSGFSDGVECLCLGKKGKLFVGGYVGVAGGIAGTGTAAVQVRAKPSLDLGELASLSAVYEDADFPFQISSPSSTTMGVFTRDPNVATASPEGAGFKLKFMGIGSTQVVAEQPGNWEYLPGIDSIEIQVDPKALHVKADEKAKTYGDTDPTLTYVVQEQNRATWTGSLQREPGEDVDTYGIQMGTLSPGSRYTVDYTPASLTIQPKTLKVTANSITKEYGDSDPVLTYTQTGLLTTDAITGKLQREAGETVEEYEIQKGTLAANSNYTLDFTPGLFTISKRSVSVTLDPKSKDYGSTDPVLTYTATGLLNQETLTGAPSREPGDTVGTYEIQPGTIAGAGYYNLQFTPANFQINPKMLVISANVLSKKYGDPDPVLTYDVDGLEKGDQITGALSRKAGETAGKYPIQIGTLDAGPNYDISFQTADFTIQAATVDNLPWKTLPSLALQVKNGMLYSGTYSGVVRIRNMNGNVLQMLQVGRGTSYALELPHGAYVLEAKGAQFPFTW